MTGGEDVQLPQRPCVTCPFRRDVPSGIWSAEEYGKLPGLDGPVCFQSFGCHQADGNLCAGWVATLVARDAAWDHLGLRIAAAAGQITPETYRVAMTYTTDVPLFADGAQAAEHGLREIEAPGCAARQAVAGLERKRGKTSRSD